MWQEKTFEQLTTSDLHQIYQARLVVFVVEQACAYQDVDHHDRTATHLWYENDGHLVAYCRLIPQAKLIKLGRVLVMPNWRGQGLGQDLVAKALSICDRKFPDLPVFAQAQTHLTDFYAQFGFKPQTESYLEDGIPHTDMLLKRR